MEYRFVVVKGPLQMNRSNDRYGDRQYRAYVVETDDPGVDLSFDDFDSLDYTPKEAIKKMVYRLKRAGCSGRLKRQKGGTDPLGRKVLVEI